MAKICENIICGEKYFFRNGQSELICRSKNREEQIMAACCDFDVLEENGFIHIAAADREGNLVYIINNKKHWGRGVAASGVIADNIFINKEQNYLVVYYINGAGLYKICLNDGARKPILIDEISNAVMPFVFENAVYYINKKEKLSSNDRKEICEGRNISYIFATNKYLCIKDDSRLNLISTSDFTSRQSLTRRHSRRAQCPVIMNMGDVEILCWFDGENVFFSKKENGLWCGIETVTAQNAERLGIYKFDGKYDLGCLKNGQICSFNIKAPTI